MRGLLIFAIIAFACRFDLDFGLIWLLLLLCFGYDCAGGAYVSACARDDETRGLPTCADAAGLALRAIG